MIIVSKDLVVLAGQGNLTIPPFAKYTPQPASHLLNTHHSLIRLVAAYKKRLKIIIPTKETVPFFCCFFFVDSNEGFIYTSI
jgi:hypothetical protein